MNINYKGTKIDIDKYQFEKGDIFLYINNELVFTGNSPINTENYEEL